MKRYDAERWAELGSAVRRARRRKGYRTGKEFAGKVGRSSRQVLELERGGQVGDETLEMVEMALGWEPGTAEQILAGTAGEVAEDGNIFRTRTLVSEITDDTGRVVGTIAARDLAMWPVAQWEELSDFELAQTASAVAEEMQRRFDNPAGRRRPLRQATSLAADDPGVVSEGARRRTAQDAAGEEPQVEP